jgi:hypothetical protein
VPRSSRRNAASVIRRVFAGMVVDDLAAAGAWYERVLGRPADAAPMPGLLEWHFTESSRLQVVDIQTVRAVLGDAQWGAAGASSVSFVVERLDDQLAVFASNGIAVGPMFSTEGSLKTASVKDPAGNLVTFVEELAGSRR